MEQITNQNGTQQREIRRLEAKPTERGDDMALFGWVVCWWKGGHRQKRYRAANGVEVYVCVRCGDQLVVLPTQPKDSK